jgi:hypothetical protein
VYQPQYQAGFELKHVATWSPNVLGTCRSVSNQQCRTQHSKVLPNWRVPPMALFKDIARLSSLGLTPPPLHQGCTMTAHPWRCTAALWVASWPTSRLGVGNSRNQLIQWNPCRPLLGHQSPHTLRPDQPVVCCGHKHIYNPLLTTYGALRPTCGDPGTRDISHQFPLFKFCIRQQ